MGCNLIFFEAKFVLSSVPALYVFLQLVAINVTAVLIEFRLNHGSFYVY